MKAWQFHEVGRPLRRAEILTPPAGHDEVVIEVSAAGLCHTDVGVLEEEGWAGIIAHRPITLGHEIAGVVTAVGAGVDSWRSGDRVCVWPSSATRPGFSRDGGFAEFTTARADDLVAIPAGVDAVLAATATDAGMTTYSALVHAGGVGSGTRVGIIGIGGLGSYAAQIAEVLGADVHLVDISPGARALARRLGFARVHDSVDQWRGLDLEVIVDFAGAGSTTETAVEVIGQRGTVVLVGMARHTANLSTRSLIFNRCRLVGSMGGSIDDLGAVLDLLQSGQLRPAVTSIAFDDIPDGLARLARGEVQGRLVAEFGSST